MRRLIGYDRYEGLGAWRALIQLYEILRLYVNFFQPSMKPNEERFGCLSGIGFQLDTNLWPDFSKERWTPSVGPLGGISKVDSAVLVAASKGNSERGRA